MPPNGFTMLRNEFDAILIGAIGDPRVPDNTHAREILLNMRFELDLYVNYRPVKLLDERLCPLKGRGPGDVDFAVVGRVGAVIGIDGLPDPMNAGNVLLPSTVAKLSLRLPPTLDAERASALMGTLLQEDPPYGAQVEYTPGSSAVGWNAPATSSWLQQSLQRASQAAFGAPPAYMGEGGTIPFMAMLGEKFPQAQFVVTGVLGPHSNAHGPNEFLHIPTGKRISVVIAQVLADQYAQATSRS